MPTYEYACKNCGHDIEVFQRMSEEPLEVCPACEQPSLKRKIGRGAGIIFKGGGFYETDFKDKKGSSSSPSKGGEESKGKDSGSSSESAKPASSNAEATS